VEDRAYLSIGEVLSLLKEEFPDVTISKIRFLESQGLLDPERTPSGYRKFYETDVERLRWILRQQREHFLPLRVIKGRLGAMPAAEESTPEASQHDGDHGDRLSGLASGVSLGAGELARAAGLSPETLGDLERFGLLPGRSAGGVAYDEDDLVVANLAAAFLRLGVEPRHLRIYVTASERETGLLTQVVGPQLRQRDPRARRQAVRDLEELAHLGRTLRETLTRRALRAASGPD
jgi:DNA-binding transcriptional MerR regulator